MRAGYTAVFLAALGSIGMGAVVTSAIAPSPTTIAAVLGLDGADPPDLEVRRWIAVERWVARCMAGAGFAYVALAPAPPPFPDADLDPIAWADRWGFGVTTVPPDAGASAQPDPNPALTARLGPRDARRSRAALDGPGGCRDRATEAIYGLRARLLAPLEAELAALHDAVEADPTMTPVRVAWGTCVERAADIIGVPGPDRTRERLVPTGLDILARRAAALGAVDRPGRARLRAAERHGAGIIARCERAYADERARVAIPHEARVLRDRGPALRRIGAAIRAAEAALPAVLPP